MNDLQRIVARPHQFERAVLGKSALPRGEPNTFKITLPAGEIPYDVKLMPGGRWLVTIFMDSKTQKKSLLIWDLLKRPKEEPATPFCGMTFPALGDGFKFTTQLDESDATRHNTFIFLQSNRKTHVIRFNSADSRNPLVVVRVVERAKGGYSSVFSQGRMIISEFPHPHGLVRRDFLVTDWVDQKEFCLELPAAFSDQSVSSN